jgi:hypothetical protein
MFFSGLRCWPASDRSSLQRLLWPRRRALRLAPKAIQIFPPLSFLLVLARGPWCRFPARPHDGRASRQSHECDELWAYVAKKQKNVRRSENPYAVGDQYTFIALASSSKAIIGYRTGKRHGPTTDESSRTYASA